MFGEEGLGLGGDWEAAAQAAVAAAACGEGESGGGGGGGRKSERKKLACGMCGAMRTPEDVSFRMTAKMVRETLFHVRCLGKWLKQGFHADLFVNRVPTTGFENGNNANNAAVAGESAT